MLRRLEAYLKQGMSQPDALARLRESLHVRRLPGGGRVVCVSSRTLRVVEAQVGPQEQDYSIIHKIVQKEKPSAPSHRQIGAPALLIYPL